MGVRGESGNPNPSRDDRCYGFDYLFNDEGDKVRMTRTMKKTFQCTGCRSKLILGKDPVKGYYCLICDMSGTEYELKETELRLESTFKNDCYNQDFGHYGPKRKRKVGRPRNADKSNQE